jgi:His-Xaa-Ser system protein HxsD
MPMENLQVNKKDNSVTVFVNTSIYPLDVIYSASYVFLDRAYVLIDGDPKKAVTVKLLPKEKQDPEKMGMEFNNELLNYSLYKKQSEKNAAIREAMLQRALLTAEFAPEAPSVEIPEFEEADADFLEDPEGIAIPWEEKFGKEAKRDAKKSKKC